MCAGTLRLAAGAKISTVVAANSNLRKLARHAVSPTTDVLTPTDPKSLNYGSTAELPPLATAEDPSFSRLRPAAASTAMTNAKVLPYFRAVLWLLRPSIRAAQQHV